MKARLAALIAVTVVGCRTRETIVEPDPHLERMLTQPKVLPYQESDLLPKGMTMQRPPDGTLPTTALLDGPLVRTGAAHGHWADRIPIAVDRALVEEGRRHFDRYCAACHGILGDGDSPVADRMALRRPQNLLEDRVRGYSPGRLFQAVREGYGLMPSYAVQLSERDAWGVVAYVEALQMARGVRVADLPRGVSARLATEAP